MRTSLSDLLATGRPLLADGATGTNYFAAGLTSGEPPEFWTVDHPDRVQSLHQRFVDAGADIILTNTFGCNPQRLKLHKAEARTYELAKRAAELAREVADAAPRPVVVGGSVGPTGELFEPLGALTHEVAVVSFREQIRGLKDGGADVVWIETMSAAEEVHAAVTAAIAEVPRTRDLLGALEAKAASLRHAADPTLVAIAELTRAQFDGERMYTDAASDQQIFKIGNERRIGRRRLARPAAVVGGEELEIGEALGAQRVGRFIENDHLELERRLDLEAEGGGLLHLPLENRARHQICLKAGEIGDDGHGPVLERVRPK